VLAGIVSATRSLRLTYLHILSSHPREYSFN